MPPRKKTDSGEKTCIKGTCLSSFGDNSNVACVDVKDGKIVRIRPLHWDWRYKPSEFKPWKFEARGKTFVPPLKSPVPPHGIAYKKRVYSPNRILYPLKRVDWDPKGERNPQNRGNSGYVRITWDEAIDIVASEIKRIVKKYGPEGVCLQAEGHGESKVVHAAHGCSTWMTPKSPTRRTSAVYPYGGPSTATVSLSMSATAPRCMTPAKDRWSRTVPSGPKRTSAPLPPSTTAKAPAGDTASDTGKRNSPGPPPRPPNRQLIRF